jgi:hypothetical protein
MRRDLSGNATFQIASTTRTSSRYSTRSGGYSTSTSTGGYRYNDYLGLTAAKSLEGQGDGDEDGLHVQWMLLRSLQKSVYDIRTGGICGKLGFENTVIVPGHCTRKPDAFYALLEVISTILQSNL